MVLSTDTAKGRYFAKKDGTYDEEAERLKREEAAKNGIGPDDGDAKEGGKIFKAKCATCHTVNAGGPNLQGPNLHGIMTRVAGKVHCRLPLKVHMPGHLVWAQSSRCACPVPATAHARRVHSLTTKVRAAPQSTGFKFTDGFKKAEFEWSSQTMFDYLAAPKKYVKGTNMAFPGFKKESDRANVVAYLNAQK